MSAPGAEPTAKRELSLDVLRGFGVLGILMVNIQAFSMPFMAYVNPLVAPFPFEGAGKAVWTLTHVFFDQKFVTIFSFLFGASIFMVGAERSDKERGARLRRRLFWLLIFGLSHGLLLWFGDILLIYAVSGFIVMLMRSWAPRRLIIVGLVLFFLGALWNTLMMAPLASAPPDVVAEVEQQAWTPSPESVAAEIDAYQSGLVSAISRNAESWATLQVFVALITMYWRTVGIMLIGLALFKTGVLLGRRSARFYTVLIGCGAAAAAVILWETIHIMADGFPFPATPGWRELGNYFLSPVVSLGYIGALLLLLRTSWFAGPAGALAAVGRMAFTNYIAQSLIMTTIFWGGRGFGMFGEIDRPGQFALVLAVWALQLVWSPLWLKRYRMGPLEWVWRVLTYKTAPPLRRAAPAG